MFDYLYEWILNLAFYMVLITAVMQIIPNSGYKKYVRFFTGLVLILLVLSPVLKLFGMEAENLWIYESESYNERIEKMKELEDLQGLMGEEEMDAIRVDEIEVGR